MLPEQEGLVSSQGHDIIHVCKTWWNDSHSWSTGMEGQRLFRSNRKSREGGGIALYVREGLIAQPSQLVMMRLRAPERGLVEWKKRSCCSGYLLLKLQPAYNH